MKQKSLKLSLAICIFFSWQALAIDHKCTAMLRDGKGRLVSQQVAISDLKSNESFDGKYIKVVQGAGEEAVAFDSPLSLRACTVYFHMSKARNFFLEKFQINKLKRPRALVARIEMDQGYNDSTHFISTNLGHFYNNALTIPPSGLQKLPEIKAWSYEIWFAPKKKIKVKSSLHKAAQVASSGPVISGMITGVVESQLTVIAQQLAQGAKIGLLEAEYYTKSLLFSVGVMALVPQVVKWGSALIKKSIYLDTAMIPEVIYHEFSHYALSEIVSIDSSRPVVEAIANFYAAMIGDTDAILKKTGEFSKGLLPISAKGDKMYDYYMEDQIYAQLDFGFKFLYGLKREFGKEFAEQLVFKSIQNLEETDMELKSDLVPALFASLKEQHPSYIYRFHQLAQSFGF